MSTVTGYQIDLILHPRMEGERSTTKINSTYVCLPTQYQIGLRVNLVLKSEKMPPMDNGYTGTAEDRKD